MKARMRVAATSIAGAAVIAAGGTNAALASPGGPAMHATASTHAAARAGRRVVLDCSGDLVVRPSIFTIACADAGAGVKHLHWTSWRRELASGYGTFWENDCKPNCADGKIRYYRSVEVLWGNARVKGHPGEWRYTKITVIFTGSRRPPVYVLKNGKIVATHPLTQTFPAV